LTLRTRLWQFKLTWGTFQNALPVLKRFKNPSGFGVRWQAERDTAFGGTPNQPGAPDLTKAPSPLRFAGAVQDVVRILGLFPEQINLCQC
jgi:hypothetical protein